MPKTAMMLAALLTSLSANAGLASGQEAKAIEIPKPGAFAIYLDSAFWGLFTRKDDKNSESGGVGSKGKRNADRTLSVSVPEKDVREAWISFHMGPKEKQDYELVMYLTDFPKGQKFALLNTKPAKWTPSAEVDLPEGTVKVEIRRAGAALSCKVNDKEHELKINDESAKTATWEPGFSLPPGGKATIAYVQYK